MMRYVVIGGGVAGVSCARALAELVPRHLVTLVSGSCLVKCVSMTLVMVPIFFLAGDKFLRLCARKTL